MQDDSGEEMEWVVEVSAKDAGDRLDGVLARGLEEFSRSRVKDLILAGAVSINGQTVDEPKYKVKLGEAIVLLAPPPEEAEPIPENIPLDILYEDDQLIVINKPVGMVVHPAVGNLTGTLVNALLYHCGESLVGIGGVKRPGIVHRLDKDTSGLLVIAKTERAYDSLTRQLVARTVSRRYAAVVHGCPAAASGVVDAPIGRDPHHRQRMAVRPAGKGKRAVSRWRVVERFAQHTHVEVSLDTGRTHQIRVHLASLGHPVVGDAVYGARRRPPIAFEGLALHAAALAFLHPGTHEMQHFTASLPDRMERLLCHLRYTGADPPR